MAFDMEETGTQLVPRELRGVGSLQRLNGARLASVSCYVLEELDQAGEVVWRGFCQVQDAADLQPGKQRLVLRLENGLSAVLEDARVSLEADSHSLRVTFGGARPRRNAGVATRRPRTRLRRTARNEENPQPPIGALPPRPRIGVIGPGAMGCLFGGLLAVAGHEVWMLCRRGELAELLERQGVLVEDEHSTRRVTVRATVEAVRAEPLDLAIVLVKSYDTASAARAVQSALGPTGLALTLQNGLGNLETLAAVLGSERILGGVTAQGATLLGPGHVRHAGSGPTTIATCVPRRGGRPAAATRRIDQHPSLASEHALQIAGLLSDAGLPTTVADDLGSLLWGKLVVSAAANGLTALSGLRNGELLESPLSLVMDDLARETAAVAAAIGVSLPYADPVKHTHSIMRATAANRSSMLQDVEAGRPTEIGALNQAVGAEGARLGLRTPLNHAVSMLIRELEDRSAGTPSARPHVARGRGPESREASPSQPSAAADPGK